MSGPLADAGVLAPFREQLLAWSAGARRDLPWRRTRDPWAILVSELMLQQTQVPRVLPRYQSFLRAFPTVAACAAAPLADVVRAWDGLGYNRRAVSLHRTAAIVVERHGGRLPNDLDGLLALPGVGPYTARAVLAFAFERDVGVVDVNAARVLARAVTGRRLDRTDAQATADALVPPGEGWGWNQAMLDLGAGWCRPRPVCPTCPVATACAWQRTGPASPDPARATFGTGPPQSRFEGSDRQGRGRLIAALRQGPVRRDDLAATMGWPDDPGRVARVAEGLMAEGLVATTDSGDELVLPDGAASTGNRVSG